MSGVTSSRPCSNPFRRLFGRPSAALALAALGLALVWAPQSALAVSGTWTGGTSTDWGTATNWSGSTIAGQNISVGTNTTDTATFNSAATYLTVLPDLNRYIGNITFDTVAGNFVIGSAVGNTLYLGPNTVQIAKSFRSTGATETIAAPINLYKAASATTGSTTTFSNASYDSTNSMVFSGPITTNEGTTSSVATLTLSGSGSYLTAAQTNNLISGVISDGYPTAYLRVTKYGLSNWTLNAANSFYGVVYDWGGSMTLDFSANNTPDGNNILWHGLASGNQISIESASLIL